MIRPRGKTRDFYDVANNAVETRFWRTSNDAVENKLNDTDRFYVLRLIFDRHLSRYFCLYPICSNMILFSSNRAKHMMNSL